MLEIHHPTQSHIASSGQAFPLVEASHELLLTLIFIAALNELLDRSECRTTARAFCPEFFVLEKSHIGGGARITTGYAPGERHHARYHNYNGYTSRHHDVGGDRGACRSNSEGAKGYGYALYDRASQPFTPEILAITVSPYVQTPRTDGYWGEGDLVEHIQRHEVFFLGRKNDDNHFALLFPTTLGGVISHWFFGFPKASVKSWGDLKDRINVQYMGVQQLLNISLSCVLSCLPICLSCKTYQTRTCKISLSWQTHGPNVGSSDLPSSIYPYEESYHLYGYI